jgi:hypothetical protein
VFFSSTPQLFCVGLHHEQMFILQIPDSGHWKGRIKLLFKSIIVLHYKKAGKKHNPALMHGELEMDHKLNFKMYSYPHKTKTFWVIQSYGFIFKLQLLIILQYIQIVIFSCATNEHGCQSSGSEWYLPTKQWCVMTKKAVNCHLI